MMAVSHSKSSIASKPSRPATILAAFFASSHSYIMTILYIHLTGLGTVTGLDFFMRAYSNTTLGREMKITRNSPLTGTPTPTSTPTMTPALEDISVPTDTPIPTAAAAHTPVPADTPAPTSTPEPTETPVPPTQTPAVVIVVVTATPSADATSGGGCNSAGAMPAGTAAVNLMFMLAPLAIIGGVRYRRRKMGSYRYEWKHRRPGCADTTNR